MRKIWVFALFGLLCITTSAKAKVCFLPGIFGGDESCLSDSQYAECKGFEQTSPCPAGQEQITCTKNNKVYYHCYCRADTYNLIDHPEYRCKKGYTTECGCAAENLECAPEYIYEGDGMGHCKDYANTDGIGACVLPNGKVFYKDCECNKDKFPYSCRETGFKRPIDGDTRCEDPHGVELYSKCVCDENAGWSEFCENREDGCTQSKSQNTVGETTCSQCEEITCESDDFVNIEAYLCGASKTVTFDCETLGYIYAPAGVCPPGTGNAGKTGVKCPFDRNYMNCEELIACQNLTTCLQANEGATKCEEDPDVAGCYNVTECDEENGYYFDGQQCQISICPSGYKTSVKACVGDGYLFDTNGKSGGEDCAKCICEPSESCVYTPQKNDVSILSINGKSYKAVYAGNASVSGSCCNGYFKTCTSNCEGRKLVSDYDVNMEEYDLCEACGEKYYTITKCKDSFEIKNGVCVASSCDTVNGFSTEVENGSQCKTASGLYEGALGWALELQKDALGEVVRSGGANCAKCVCSEPTIPSSTTACRWSNFNKNINGYLKAEDLCCNGYYKNCYADFPAQATPEACNDIHAEQKDTYAACDYANACIIRSCKNGYTLENNKCVAAECASPYSSVVQNVSECGTGSGWKLNIAQDENHTYIKSGELYCTQCQCNAATNCTWDESNKGTSSLTDLCCNGKYATCTSSCSGYLESNLVSGSGASVEQGVATRTECKACGISYWTATSCKTDNGYKLTSDGRCERIGCPSGYTSGLTECDAGFKFEAHTQTDNGEICGKCVAKTCADYEDYPLAECPTNWACTHELKNVGSTTKECYAKSTCDDNHCGIDCATATNLCNGYNLEAIENANMGNDVCEKRTGSGTNMCSEITPMYKTFTCKEGFKKDGNSCVAKTCADYEDYPLSECPAGYGCSSASKKLGNASKTCYVLSSCDDSHCGTGCATQTNPCNGYDLPSIDNATMGADKCDKVTGGGTGTCTTTAMYKTFTCNDGFKKNTQGTACIAKSCEDYEGWFTTCPANWTCTKEGKKTGSTTTQCSKKNKCDASHCGADCSTATNSCSGYPYQSVAHATMSTNKCDKITGAGTNTCSAVTVMYENFTCDDANGWKKNSTNTACIAKTCADFTGYYDTCPANKACVDRNVTLGGVAKVCKELSGGCDSTHCGADCSIVATTCSGAYTSTIANATMQGECAETCSDKKTWTGFECNTGYKKSGNTCAAKTCADNTDGYVYVSENACKTANPGKSCTESGSTYKLGETNQKCWKVGTSCDSTHCGADCSIVATTCSGTYTSTIANATMQGECAETCSTKKTWTGFECNTGYKKSGNTCAAKTCADNTDGYVYVSENACKTANSGHACTESSSTYKLGETNQKCWKVDGCDSAHCGADCSTETRMCGSSQYPYTDTASGKPAHSFVSGESCTPVSGSATCTTGTTRYKNFVCDTANGWKKNTAGTDCVAMTCEDYGLSGYSTAQCGQGQVQNLASDKMIGGVLTTCRTCINATCPAGSATTSSQCGTGKRLSDVGGNATGYSGDETCYPCVCDQDNGYYASGNFSSNAVETGTAVDGCYPITGCSSRYIDESDSNFSNVLTYATGYGYYTTTSGTQIKCYQFKNCAYTLGTAGEGQTNIDSNVFNYSSFTISNRTCYYPTGCKTGYLQNHTCDWISASSFETESYGPVGEYTCRKCSTCDVSSGEYGSEDTCKSDNFGFTCTQDSTSKCWSPSGCDADHDAYYDIQSIPYYMHLETEQLTAKNNYQCYHVTGCGSAFVSTVVEENSPFVTLPMYDGHDIKCYGVTCRSYYAGSDPYTTDYADSTTSAPGTAYLRFISYDQSTLGGATCYYHKRCNNANGYYASSTLPTCGCGEARTSSSYSMTLSTGAPKGIPCAKCSVITCSSGVPSGTNYIDSEGINYGPLSWWTAANLGLED